MGNNKKSSASNHLGGGGGDIDDSHSSNTDTNKFEPGIILSASAADGRSRRRGSKGGGGATKSVAMQLSKRDDDDDEQQQQQMSSSFQHHQSKPQHASAEIQNSDSPLLPRKRSQATKSPVPPDFHDASDDYDENEGEQNSGDDELISPLQSTATDTGGILARVEDGGNNTISIAVKNNMGGGNIQVDNDEHEVINARAREQQDDLNSSGDFGAASALALGGASTSFPISRRSTDNNPKKHMTPKRRRKQSNTEAGGQEQHHPQQHELQLHPKLSSTDFPPNNRRIDGRESISSNNDNINSVLFSPKPTSHRHKSQNYPPPTSSRRPRPPGPAPPSPMITSATTFSATGGEALSSPSSTPIQSQSFLLSPSSDVTSTTTTPFRFHSFPASLPRVNPRSSSDSATLREEDDDDDGFDRSGDYDNEYGGIDYDDDGEQHSQNPFLFNTTMPTTARKQPLTLHPRRNRRELMLTSSTTNPAAATTTDAMAPARPPPPSPASRRLFVPRTMDETKGAHNNNNNSSRAPTLMAAYAASFSPSSSSSSSSSFSSPERNDRVRMSKNGPASPATVMKKMEAKHTIKGLDDEDNELLDEDDESGSSTLSCEEDVSGKRLNFNSPIPPLGSGDDGDDQEELELQRHPPPRQTLETALHPHTPRGILLTATSANAEGQLHMMPNLEVSPITRFPEDYDVDCHEMVVDPTTAAGENNDDIDDGGSRSSAPQQFSPPKARKMNAGESITEISSENTLHRLSNEEKVEGNSGIMDTSAHSSSSSIMLFSTNNIKGNDISNASAASLPSRHSLTSNESTATTVNKTNLSYSHTLNTTTTTTTHRPTARKSRRPMPDTSAFDVSGAGNTHTPSQQSLGSKDSGFHSHKTGGTGVGSMTSGGGGSHHQARLFCPPTPIRTPAWAHHAAVDRGGGQGSQQHVLKRANSLISTKVLAMMPCPSRVLDNLSSLEDSMLENDISGSTLDTSTVEYNLNQNNAFLTFPLEEKDEYDECMFRSLEGGSGDEEISTASPLDQSHDEISSVVPSGVSSSRNDAISGGGSIAGPSPHSSMEGEDINFSDFDNLGMLGSGAFADVYKVRSRKRDRRLYAIKRTRRQFRGVKDRERAMAEVNTMKLLQSALFSEAAAAATSSTSSHQQERRDCGANSAHHHSKNNYGLYLLFFIRAWQQDGFFYCQTELCSRATCRHLRLSLSNDWARDVVRYPSLKLCQLKKNSDIAPPSSAGEKNNEIQFHDDCLIPERDVWQICHDISRGLFHIHSYGMVHYDIKPSNIFFAYNSKWGAICKIGDFGLAGEIGTRDDGQEGDTVYMPSEVLLSSCEKHPSADVFSLGLALYELAASPMWLLPREGDRWHEIRSGTHRPDLPPSRSESLVKLIQDMTRPTFKDRPSAESILELIEVKRANATSDSFLSRYITDVERYDLRREKEIELAEEEARRRYEHLQIQQLI
jgi:serine/threonine protein kinase